jgi:hypothetical protein
MQSLGAQAEAQRNARFGQLGAATQMKNADLMQQFDINKMTPYNRQFGLKQLKSQAANQQYSQDVQSTFGALGNLASMGMMADYGGGGNQDRLQKKYNANNVKIKNMIGNPPQV